MTTTIADLERKYNVGFHDYSMQSKHFGRPATDNMRAMHNDPQFQAIMRQTAKDTAVFTLGVGGAYAGGTVGAAATAASFAINNSGNGPCTIMRAKIKYDNPVIESLSDVYEKDGIEAVKDALDSVPISVAGADYSKLAAAGQIAELEA